MDKPKRAAVFIDGSNFYFKMKSLGIKSLRKYNYRGLFYWYEWRPVKIRQECFKISQAPSQDITDNNYKNCLKNSGLEK